MSTKKIQIIIEGATGRLGNMQHLRSLLNIRKEGGLLLKNGDKISHTQDAVVLEKMISQFLYNKASDTKTSETTKAAE